MWNFAVVITFVVCCDTGIRFFCDFMWFFFAIFEIFDFSSQISTCAPTKFSFKMTKEFFVVSKAKEKKKIVSFSKKFYLETFKMWQQTKNDF